MTKTANPDGEPLPVITRPPGVPATAENSPAPVDAPPAVTKEVKPMELGKTT